jgi:hypothetical protein
MSKKGFVEAAEKTYEKKIVHIFLGSPWYISISNEAKITREKPFLVREGFIENSAKEHFHISNKSLIPLEQKIVSVKAHGYHFENLVGKKVQTMTIKSLVNASQMKLVEKIGNAIHFSFPNTEIHFHTTTQAVFPIVRELLNKEDFILVIPEHEISEIILSKKGMFESTISIPFGKYSPVREASAILKKDKMVAKSIIKLFMEKKLSDVKIREVYSAIMAIKERFQALFREALWKLSPSVLLPRDIVISDKSPISKQIGEWIKSESWSKSVFGGEGINIYFLENTDLLHQIKRENELHYFEPILISAGLYLRSL